MHTLTLRGVDTRRRIPLVSRGTLPTPSPSATWRAFLSRRRTRKAAAACREFAWREARRRPVDIGLHTSEVASVISKGMRMGWEGDRECDAPIACMRTLALLLVLLHSLLDPCRKSRRSMPVAAGQHAIVHGPDGRLLAPCLRERGALRNGHAEEEKTNEERQHPRGKNPRRERPSALPSLSAARASRYFDTMVLTY